MALRRSRFARNVAVVVGCAMALGGGAVAVALDAISQGATVARPADRVVGQTEYPIDLPVPPRHTFLISDSVLAGIRTTGNLGRLTGTTWISDLELCRRLVARSCQAAGAPRPPTVVGELAQLPVAPDEFDLLVVATGYNDDAARFGADVATVVAAARAAGFRHVAWLTYRTDATGALFVNYAAMNAILDQQLATGAYPDVTVWDFDAVTTGRDDWFLGDDIHLSPTGARGIADWLSAMAAATDVAPAD